MGTCSMGTCSKLPLPDFDGIAWCIGRLQYALVLLNACCIVQRHPFAVVLRTLGTSYVLQKSSPWHKLRVVSTEEGTPRECGLVV